MAFSADVEGDREGQLERLFARVAVSVAVKRADCALEQGEQDMQKAACHAA
jgi:hypothetical protein